jgi:hypothetical protein
VRWKVRVRDGICWCRYSLHLRQGHVGDLFDGDYDCGDSVDFDYSAHLGAFVEDVFLTAEQSMD